MPPTGCLQGGAAAPKKILAGGRLDAVVCHAESQAAALASAACPTNLATAERLRLVPRATTRGEVSISFTACNSRVRQKVLFRGTKTGRWGTGFERKTLFSEECLSRKPSHHAHLLTRKYAHFSNMFVLLNIFRDALLNKSSATNNMRQISGRRWG